MTSTAVESSAWSNLGYTQPTKSLSVLIESVKMLSAQEFGQNGLTAGKQLAGRYKFIFYSSSACPGLFRNV